MFVLLGTTLINTCYFCNWFDIRCCIGTTITYYEYHHNVLGVLSGTTIMSNILGYHHNILGYYHNEKMPNLKKKYQI